MLKIHENLAYIQHLKLFLTAICYIDDIDAYREWLDSKYGIMLHSDLFFEVSVFLLTTDNCIWWL